MDTGADCDARTVSIDVADPLGAIEALAGLSETLVVFAMVGVTETESVTVPEKLSRLLTVRVPVVEEPCATLKIPGFIVRLKSVFVALDSLQAETECISHPE